jgi:hypothetical protein
MVCGLENPLKNNQERFMTIKVTVKLDNTKFRIYLKSNGLIIGEIERYLKERGYTNVHECLGAAEKARNQHPTGYSLRAYSMAYKADGPENAKCLLIEAWLPITRHFNNSSLIRAIEDLINPVLPAIDENTELPQPNIKISDLKNRHYVTVFEQEQTTLTNVLCLVQNFETLLINVRNQVGFKTDKISSEVLVDFRSVSQAAHAPGLAVFGLMPTPTSSGTHSGSNSCQNSVIGAPH